MSLKKLIILAAIIGAAFYLVKVKGFNPFATKISDDAPLYTLEGKNSTFKDYAGENGTLIFILATWCPHCQTELSQIKSLTDFFTKNKLNVLIAMYGDTHKQEWDDYSREIREWVWSHDFHWSWHTIYYDDDMDKNFKLNKVAFPYIIALNKNNKVIHSKAGVYQSNQLSAIALEILKSNKE